MGFIEVVLNRSTSNAPASIALTDTECHLLDRLLPDKTKDRFGKRRFLPTSLRSLV
jgi:hypothetical protein